jgi:hypothetical protein
LLGGGRQFRRGRDEIAECGNLVWKGSENAVDLMLDGYCINNAGDILHLKDLRPFYTPEIGWTGCGRGEKVGMLVEGGNSAHMDRYSCRVIKRRDDATDEEVSRYKYGQRASSSRSLYRVAAAAGVKGDKTISVAVV